MDPTNTTPKHPQAGLIPLCRLYENTSKRTGNRYLAGTLTYTTKVLGFESEDENGNPCWQVYVQERPKPIPGQDLSRLRLPTEET